MEPSKKKRYPKPKKSSLINQLKTRNYPKYTLFADIGIALYVQQDFNLK